MTKIIPRLLSCTAIFAFSAMAAEAQVEFGGVYEQDFNTLPLYESSSGTAVFTFNNNSTLLGWYASTGTGQNNARSSGGAAATSGTLYNWGRTADRALGTFATNGYGGSTEYFGVQLQNTVGGTVSAISLQYVVEQWRRNTNATTWTLEYLVTSVSGDQLQADGYAVIADSTIHSATGSAGARDGDADANRTKFNLHLDGIEWQDGTYLWLRWTNNQQASSGGFGLDDLKVTAIPESRTAALVLLLPAVVLAFCFRSRR